MKEDEREIYSIQDCKDIIDKILKEELGLGESVREAILKKIECDFRYINWERFQHANCPGCVSSPNDCSIAYGRGEFYGMWAKIANGKYQSCPARTNGTMCLDEKGLRSIDIADHKFNVVELLEPIREN